MNMRAKLAAFAMTAVLAATQTLAQTDPILNDEDFISGEEAFTREAFDSASAFFEKSLLTFPKSAIGHNWLGCSQRNAGDFEAALQSYLKADKLVKRGDKDTKTSILQGLSTTYKMLNDYDKAISYADQLIEADDKVAIYYTLRATLSEENNDTESAIAYYQKAINLSPGATINHQSISRIYLGAGEYDKAINIATKALDIDGRDADAYEGRAWAYTLKGDYTKAVADLFECINSFGRPYTLATRLTIEAPSRMRWAWKSEMRSNPYWSLPWDVKGEVDLVLGDAQSALKAAQEGRKRAFGDAICSILQSEEYIELKLGNWDRAEKIAKANHLFAPTNSAYLIDLIDIAMERNDQGVDSLLEEINELRPNYLYYYAAVTRSGNKSLIKRELPNIAKYVRLNPKDEDGYKTKAMMHETLGEHAEAVECAKMALDVIEHKPAYQKAAYRDDLDLAKLFFYAIMGKTGADADSLIARIMNLKIKHNYKFSSAACLLARQGRNAEAIALIDSALQHGYYRIHWLERNPLLSSISGTNEFRALIKPYKERAEKECATCDTDSTKMIAYTTDSDLRPKVEGSIGSLKVDITFDEKRTYASISDVESDFMLKNGIITRSDIYSVKNGDIVVVKNLKFGDVTLPKVKLWIEEQKTPIILDRQSLCVVGLPKVDKEKKAITLTILGD